MTHTLPCSMARQSNERRWRDLSSCKTDGVCGMGGGVEQDVPDVITKVFTMGWINLDNGLQVDRGPLVVTLLLRNYTEDVFAPEWSGRGVGGAGEVRG